ncbi:MAG: hypothetical protein WBF93_07210 [Pirellulales bacterium]|nr:hypothetical protein [Pirellulales bacterium]
MSEEDNAQADSPKNAWVAAALSFILPGAGLTYLGKPGAAAINLLVAIVLTAAALLVAPQEVVDHVHYLYLVIAVGSGAWAHATANRNGGAAR